MKKVIALVITLALTVSMLMGCAKDEVGETSEQSTQIEDTEGQKDQKESVTTEPSAEEEVTLLFWHSYSDGEETIFKDVVLPMFYEKHPNIIIDAVRMPYEGMNEQLITAVTGNAAPDVMRMDLTWVSQMAKMGVLEEVSSFNGFQKISENTLEGSMMTNYYDGKYYGLPLNANTTVAIYNNNILKKLGFDGIPETLDDFLETKDNLGDEQWLLGIGGTYNWAMLPFLWTLGGEVTDETYTTATGYLNSKETVKALETMVDWYQDGIIGPSIMGEQPDAWGGMDGENYGMIVEGPWYFSSADQLDKVTPTLFPSVNGNSFSIVGGEDVVMIKSSEKKDAAWLFMQFLMEDEPQVAMAKAGMIPTSNSALEAVDTSDSPYVDVYIEQLKTAKPRIPNPSWPSIEEILNMAFENVFRGNMTAQEALDNSATEIDELLAQ